MSTPVSEETAVEAPTSMEVKVKMLFRRARKIQTICAIFPYRTLMIPRRVWALGAFSFAWIARKAKKQIMVLCPLAHQMGSAMP
jgi:hypothetical protein